jgi:hypothetical protein
MKRTPDNNQWLLPHGHADLIALPNSSNNCRKLASADKNFRHSWARITGSLKHYSMNEFKIRFGEKETCFCRNKGLA